MPAKEQLAKAFDSTGDNSNAVHLSHEEASAFIDLVRDESTLLKLARVEKVDLATKSLPRLISSKRFLHAGGKGVALDDDKKDSFGTDNIEIHTREVIGAIEIHDSELKHNIEGQSLGEKMLNLAAKKIANELEEIAMYADKLGTWSATESAFALYDGFVKRLKANGNLIDAADTDLFADAKVSKEKMVRLLTSVPTKFRKDLQFFLHDNVAIEYNEQFDQYFQSQNFVGNVLGKRINSVPLMRIDDTTGKTEAIATDPMNLIFAMQVEDGTISFEKERVAKERKTVYHFSMEMDFQIEVPEAAGIITNLVTKY